MPRAERERRFRLALHDPQPVERAYDIWSSVARVATIGMFLLMLITALYLGRALLLPIMIAAVIGETFAPVVSAAAHRGVPRTLTAALLVCIGIAAVGAAVTMVAAPLGELVGRAPELGASVQQKLYVFDRPLSALRDLQSAVLPASGNVVKLDNSWVDFASPVLGFLTPALGQLALFLIVLFFVLAGERDFRNFVVSMMPSRDAKLRFLRIANDVRRNLAGYLWVVTFINVSIGILVSLGTWLLGFPSPLLFGLMATVLNYIPYLGSVVTAGTLFAVGLVVFPTLSHALIAPIGYVVIAAIEAQVVTPLVLGRRLTLNPLTIVLALAFWTFLWGPMGAFIAAPISIIILVTVGHLFPAGDPRLPE